MLRSLTDMPDSNTDDDRAEYLTRLGTVLKEARKVAGMSQEVAAAHVGMSTGTFTRWEAGENGISAYDLRRLILLYDFDPDLAVNPPASKVAIRRRLGPLADRARRAIHPDLPPPPADDDEPE